VIVLLWSDLELLPRKDSAETKDARALRSLTDDLTGNTASLR